MPQYFLLNDSIEFHPEVGQLVPRETSGQAVILNSPTSRCLQLLLERRYSLVSQQEFYGFVWGEEGHTVPVNTLYQNIALLRKALRNLDEQYDDMIITVTRKGFKLNENIHVQEMSDEITPGCNDTPVTTASPGTEQEHIETPLQKVTVNTGTLSSEPEITRLPHNISTRFRHVNILFTVKFVAVIVIFSLLGGFISGSITVSTSYFSQFKMAGKLDKCLIYSNPTNHWIVNTEDISHLNINCATTPYLYVSKHDFSTTGTIIACSTPLDKDNEPQCTSYHLLGITKNETN